MIKISFFFNNFLDFMLNVTECSSETSGSTSLAVVSRVHGISAWQSRVS